MNSHDFDGGGLDAIGESGPRTEVRNGFSHFSGHPASRTPSSLGDRRRIVIINGVSDSSTHQPWEILYNVTSYSDLRDETVEMVRSLIDSVMPGGGSNGGTTFEEWSVEQDLPEGMNGPGDDVDVDSASNLLEFYSGTDPKISGGVPFTVQPSEENAFAISYQMANERSGVTGRLVSSPDLVTWTPIEVDPGKVTMTDGDEMTEVTVVVDADVGL